MSIAALPILLTGFTSQASLIVAVGAQNAFVIRQGIARSHVPAIVGICIAADAILVTLGTRGMGVVVESHPSALSALTWIGAAVLMLYAILAFKRVFVRVRALRRAAIAERRHGGSDISATDAAGADTAAADTAATSAAATNMEQSPLRTDILACLGVTFLNPNVYLDAIVLMGGLAATYGATLKWSFAAGAILCSILWFTLLGALSATMSRLFNSAQAWIALDSVIGIAMVLISVHLALG
ncbi:LysE/ArgO family amino acid transporter [Bifidobacterium tibiigranuli]|jgi:L-lysine exporter family protein LysE/ArgO|nr:LysE family transporter [Bifidobacterium tibiigranuli]MCI1649325.1 LysE family transporter [Bifidobacterium tibiigranuli]MCI1674362.1 LysE family transporter [Bifidobacterium tibiigranuli]MCI1713294.1 LysE family transporter [Bifidobacterium tibiigranuli]MCI1833727.1 LysE family transporter [Bifidobacterium tibiigranuli]MCI2184655.1 LysE family transporter [Bifidobacterium tibiigranuli]